MKKRNVFLGLILTASLLAGCIPLSAPTATQAPVLVATQTPLVVVVTATPVQSNIVYITATPQDTDTPTPTLEPTATAVPPTQEPQTITIASVTDQGSGNILVSWQATGTFTDGFQVVWSTVNQSPIFPSDSSTYVSDSGARSAQFHGDANKLYYVRVCAYTNNTCGTYSNSSYVAVFAPTAAPYTYPVNPYPYPNPYIPPTRNSTPNPTPYTTPYAPWIYITFIQSAGYGSADLYWKAYGTFSEGFYILYGTDPAQLVYGEGRTISVPNGYTRMVTVSGHYYTTYYYKICRIAGTNCDTNSNTYAFTFTGPNSK
jgi:hypothetical protein